MSGGGWSPATQLDAEGIFPSIASNGDGDVVATWYLRDYDDDVSYHVAAYRPSGGPRSRRLS